MVAATFLVYRRVPATEDEEVEEEEEQQQEAVEMARGMKRQRRTVKFLAALVVGWTIGNAPIVVFLRGSPPMAVEAVLVLAAVGHQLVLPVATLIFRRRLWSKLRGFVRRAVRRRKRPGRRTTYRSDGEADTGNPAGGVGDDLGPDRPGMTSSPAVGAGQEPRSAHNGASRCVKFDGEAVQIHQEGHQGSENIDEQQDISHLTVNSTSQSSPGTLSPTIQSGVSFVSLFLARDSMLSALYAIANPSVCPSHGWISRKRLNLGSCNFHHTVAPSLSCLRYKFHPEIPRDPPERERQTMMG